MGTSIYPMKHTDAKAAPSRFLYITYSKYENDWNSLPHIHPFAELFYVKEHDIDARYAAEWS